MRTPIALLIFNRPDTTKKVFDGYGSDATHSKSIVSEFANIPTESMLFPMQHSKLMIRDAQADRYSQGSMIRLTRIRQIITNPLRFKLMFDNYRNSKKSLADG